MPGMASVWIRHPGSGLPATGFADAVPPGIDDARAAMGHPGSIPRAGFCAVWHAKDLPIRFYAQ
mgnify:CR=1 FL=1